MTESRQKHLAYHDVLAPCASWKTGRRAATLAICCANA